MWFPCIIIEADYSSSFLMLYSNALLCHGATSINMPLLFSIASYSGMGPLLLTEVQGLVSRPNCCFRVTGKDVCIINFSVHGEIGCCLLHSTVSTGMCIVWDRWMVRALVLGEVNIAVTFKWNELRTTCQLLFLSHQYWVISICYCLCLHRRWPKICQFVLFLVKPEPRFRKQKIWTDLLKKYVFVAFESSCHLRALSSGLFNFSKSSL